MALTQPTIEELGEFRQEPFEAGSEEAATADFVLSQATDVLWVYTGLDDLPDDPRAARIVKYAICDLALWIMSQAEHRDEINSPFTTERIGSYSYSKMQQASSKSGSGIYWLDMLFRALRASEDPLGGSWVTSERVFNPEGYSYAQERAVERFEPWMHDPSEPWGFNDV